MPTMNERQELPVKKQSKTYMGRHALLQLVLSKSPSTRKWLVEKLEKQAKVKDKAVRDMKLLAKSLGVRIVKLEIK